MLISPAQCPSVSKLVEACGGKELSVAQSTCAVLQQAAQHNWVEPCTLLSRLKVIITAAR